jgi:hypothetical protein
LVGKPEGRRVPGKDNTKMNLQGICSKARTGFIWLWIGIIGGLL